MPSPAPVRSSAHPPESAAVRVMLVDDSAVVRGLVTRWLSESPDISVVSSQRTGKGAVDSVEAANPDVVVLDIEMPEMDGLTALPLLLKKKPGLCVIMASTLTRRNADISLRAMALGARDYVAKPDAAQGLVGADDFRRELVQKIQVLGRAGRGRAFPQRVAGAPAARPGSGADISLRPVSRTRPKVLVIGSSTGGPPALTALVKGIGDAARKVPILITQHMPPTFTGILADHLARASGIPAAEGKDREPLVPGRIYVAPGGLHMRIEDTSAPMIRLDDGPQINFCRPSVDPLFQSATALYSTATLAVMLTGMGSDGSAGAVAVAERGGTVIAQDEATSIVWGMPGAAARAGACAAILPLERIGPRVAGLLRGELG